jgi:hypothetical protein
VALTALALGAACGDSTGPTDNTVLVQLTGAPGDDGALIFKVLAGGQERIDTVLPACSDCRLFSRRVSDVEVRVMITGTVSIGPLARVRVSNPVPQSYTAFAVEGASSSFESRAAGRYQLSVGR